VPKPITLPRSPVTGIALSFFFLHSVSDLILFLGKPERDPKYSIEMETVLKKRC
jgi:hypothetical protein